MLPTLLSTIDESTRGSHPLLSEDDRCLYFGEFFANTGFQGGDTNQLILNFKIEPSKITANPKRGYWKERARHEIAAALRAVTNPKDIAENCTFVPIPPSKIPGHPDYCDRGLRALREAYGLSADVRPLLRQTASTEADHQAAHRISYTDLYEITEVDMTQLATPPRKTIVLFDDVLTTGKHFKVCQRRLLEVLPDQRIVGLFVARCIHNKVDVETEFDDLGPDPEEA